MHHLRVGLVIATGVETLFHGGRKLGTNLGITITVEDRPLLERSLREHLALDLAVDVTCILLNVEAVGLSRRCGTHEQLASVILKAIKGLRVLRELEVPHLLFFNTLSIAGEVRHQVLDLLDLCFGVSVNDLGQVLHETEVSTHGVGQTGQLAELRDQSHLDACAAVLVDQKRLVASLDLLVVAGLIVLLVRCLDAILVEGRLRRLGKVDAVDAVSLLVVAGDHCAA